MDWRDAVLLCSAVIAVYTDLRFGMIKNWLTVPLFLGGLAMAYSFGGFYPVVEGIAIGAGIAVLTFIFSTPGGGDIKLALAIGPWVGDANFPAYLFGAWGLRVLLNLAVRLKMDNWNPLAAAANATIELKTWQITPLGKNNFRVFRNAAARAGADPDTPTTPGALWVAGGVVSTILLKGVSG